MKMEASARIKSPMKKQMRFLPLLMRGPTTGFDSRRPLPIVALLFMAEFNNIMHVGGHRLYMLQSIEISPEIIAGSSAPSSLHPGRLLPYELF